MTPKLAVITFPGNNCETESLRAAKRNGFEAELVLWNEPEKIGNFDAYFLIGGFSFEDRGRSGAIAAREEIFDALREEAKKGKVILGVCNGAQMIVESGLIPVGDNPVPFSLAENVRRDKDGKVLGTGYYNVWVNLKPERTDTAFSHNVPDLLKVPVAHGEGRFTSVDDSALEVLKDGSQVAFRYCDEDGKVDENFPITPNGAKFATAMVVNREGTIGAIMPHPERFYDSCDGDQIMKSMCEWIEARRSPEVVEIGDFSSVEIPEIPVLELQKDAIVMEKKLIITDNEAFSVSQTASNVAGETIEFEKSLLYEITGKGIEKKQLEDSGLIFNPNKEVLISTPGAEKKYAVLPFEDDSAVALSEKLSAMFDTEIKVRIFRCWNFGEVSDGAVNNVLQNRLLANPNSAKIFQISA